MSSPPSAATAPSPGLVDNVPLQRFLLALQLALLWLVIDQARIVSPAFGRIFLVIGLGVVVHEVVPHRLRPAFFLVLSWICTAVVLRILPTLVLVSAGIGLIGVCHLPLRLGVRVGVLMLVAAGLAALRSPTLRFQASWLPEIPIDFLLVLPVLASMFMFRLPIYLYDKENTKQPLPFTQTLNYFFMLPNVCFLLFPVVDYTTFLRSFRETERWRVQQRGMHWILTGIVQLLLLRLVELFAIQDPGSLETRLDHLLYVMSGYLLYLRVSGQFHIALGVLHLFGYELPRSHNRYFLASSFTDLWRRINIYWTECMRKMVYYPVALRLRRFGASTAASIATICVFGATVVLHAYQFYWLSGSFHISSRDLLFWSTLCGLVLFDMERERRRAQRQRTRLGAPPAPGPGLRSRWLGTAATLLVVTILWSLWSSEGLSLSEWAGILAGVVLP